LEIKCVDDKKISECCTYSYDDNTNTPSETNTNESGCPAKCPGFDDEELDIANFPEGI
jgi:hypothetical protein